MIKPLSLLLTITALANAAASISLQTHYIQISQQAKSLAITSDAAGDIFVVSAQAANSAQSMVRITKTDPQGNVVASFDFGTLTPTAAAVDSQGNLLIAGSEVGSKIAGGYAVGSTAWVFKLDNGLTKILASASLGNGATGGSNALALAADGAGNVYVTGTTWDPNFPVTPGAYQTTAPAGDTREGPFFVAVFAFVAKFTPDLSTTVYSTYFGNSSLDCISETCYLHYAATAPVGIAVDSAGAATIAGNSDSPYLANQSPQYGFPYQISPYAFMARFSADGGSLEAFSAVSDPGSGTVAAPIVGMAVDQEGDLVLVGKAGWGITTSPNSVQPVSPFPIEVSYASFVVKYDPTLQNLLWGTYFGDPSLSGANSGKPSGLSGVTTDTAGNVWVTGASTIANLPSTNSSPTQASVYVAEISADGSSVLNLLFTQQLGGYAIASTSGGAVAVLGTFDSFLLSGPPGQPALLTVTNPANGGSAGTIAPAELISLFGSGIGPASELSGQVVDGVYTNNPGGYQVLFNGTPAPLLYAGPNQINVVAPMAISGQPTASITVVGPQSTISFPTVFVAPNRPQIFTGSSGYAVALNQDGTPNSASNPAALGSVVTLWATGLGSADNQRADGSVTSVFAPYDDASITATILGEIGGTVPLPVASAGDAPFAVLGVAQINIQVPPQITGSYGFVTIQAGGDTSNQAELNVKGLP